ALKGPLDGIRVIDLGRHQAGPRCAQVLARLGAEVIKIERLGGEETRYHAPWVRKQSAYWVQYNSGKKSVSMDLRKAEGREALRKRDISGEGQAIDVCLADTGYSYTEIPISAYHGTGAEPKRDSAASMYPCKDGWVLITAGDQHHWPRMCNALGKPEWKEDPRFTSRHERSKHGEVVQAALQELMATMTMKEAIAHFT